MRRLLAVLALLLVLPAAADAQGVVDDNPAATSSAPGTLDVAARGADGTILVRSLDVATGAWSPWVPVPGVTATSGPALSADDDGTLHLFTRAGETDGVVESVRAGGVWTGWGDPVAGELLTGPATVNRNGTAELDLATVGRDTVFRFATRVEPGGAFDPFGPVGGPGATTTPGLVSRAPSHVDAFTRDGSGNVTDTRYVPGSGWATSSLAGPILGAVAAITRAPNEMDIYVRDTNGRIIGQTFNGAAWNGWQFVADPAGTSAPAAAVTGGGRVDMVVRDATTLYHAYFTPGGTWTALVPVGPIALPVDRGAVNGAGGGDGARIAIAVGGKPKRTFALGKRVTVTGGLVNAAGGPIGGATVALLGTTLTPGAAPRPLGTVTTAPDGTFAFTTKAGPGRRIEASYKAYPTDGTATATAGATARTVARATLKVSRKRVRRGQRVRFTGRLRGGSVPAGGKLVALQARERGRWRTFTNPRTTRKGAFKARYRFGSSPRRPLRLRFRVVVPREASYPFLRGGSPARKVVLLPG